MSHPKVEDNKNKQCSKGRKIPTNKEMHAQNGNSIWTAKPSITTKRLQANADKREFRTLDFTLTECRSMNNLIRQLKNMHRAQQDEIIGMQRAMARANNNTGTHSTGVRRERTTIAREREIYYATTHPNTAPDLRSIPNHRIDRSIRIAHQDLHEIGYIPPTPTERQTQQRSWEVDKTLSLVHELQTINKEYHLQMQALEINQNHEYQVWENNLQAIIEEINTYHEDNDDEPNIRITKRKHRDLLKVLNELNRQHKALRDSVDEARKLYDTQRRTWIREHVGETEQTELGRRPHVRYHENARILVNANKEERAHAKKIKMVV